MANRKGADLGNLMNYRGPWSSGVTYAQYDVVTRSSGIFVATAAPGAAGANDPASDPNSGVNSNVSTTTSTGTTYNDGNFSSISYRFTPTSNIVLAQIIQYMGGVVTTATAEIGVESGNIASDNVTPIAVTPSVATAGANGTATTFTFTTPVTLTAGVQYRIVVRSASPNGFQTFSSANYTGGTTPNDARYGFSIGASYPNRTLVGRVAFYPWTYLGTTGPTTRTISATGQLGWLDRIVLATGTITVTLPVTLSGVGRVYTIKNVGTGTITVATVSGSIDGVSTFTMSVQHSSVDLVTDGADWYTV